MILIDYKDRRPIYEQVVEKLSELMVRGIWSRTASSHLYAALQRNCRLIPTQYREPMRNWSGRGIFIR